MSLLYFKVYAFSTKSPQNNLNIKSNILQVTNKQLAPLIDENVIFFRWYHILIIQNNHIRNSADWNKVINESKVPIVLDCYATWCEPCKKLTPILEEKAKNAPKDPLETTIDMASLNKIIKILGGWMGKL